jgi:hypothetical protein
LLQHDDIDDRHQRKEGHHHRRHILNEAVSSEHQQHRRHNRHQHGPDSVVRPEGAAALLARFECSPLGRQFIPFGTEPGQLIGVPGAPLRFGAVGVGKFRFDHRQPRGDVELFVERFSVGGDRRADRQGLSDAADNAAELRGARQEHGEVVPDEPVAAPRDRRAGNFAEGVERRLPPYDHIAPQFDLHKDLDHASHDDQPQQPESRFGAGLGRSDQLARTDDRAGDNQSRPQPQQDPPDADRRLFDLHFDVGRFRRGLAHADCSRGERGGGAEICDHRNPRRGL